MTKPSASKPLAGIEVIELSNMITCSLAAMTMAAQGAEVIKVEPPAMGDKMRPLGTQKNGVSGFFHNCNRGKRSLAIDLKSEAGVEAVKKLIARADVLLHNYRPGVMDRIGLGSDVLREINPKLIYVAVSGFGTEGPMADFPAFDHVIQGLTGFTDLQSSEEDSFDHIRTFICDKVTAYTVCQAATAALLARATTNEGQVGYPELIGTPLYASIGSRMTNMKQVVEVLKNPRVDIGVEKALEILVAADVPCSPCLKRDDLENSEQIKAIGALETYVTKAMGKLTAPTPPVLFEGKSTSQAEASPLLGEHSKTILKEIGWSEEAIDDLVNSGDVKITSI